MTGSAQHPDGSPDPLYLFACRVRCLRLRDLRAYEELKRAARHPNPDIRLVAEVFLAEVQTMRPPDAMALEDSWAGCQ